MTKVGRFVTDPKAGAYCQLVLESGDKVIVNHSKGGFKGGQLTMETAKWWGGGNRFFACDLDSAEGKAALARLVKGLAEGSFETTPLAAFVNHVKECRSVDEIKTRCAELMAGT